jgi:ubiquinone biosynthesis monooxygenase Coq7
MSRKDVTATIQITRSTAATLDVGNHTHFKNMDKLLIAADTALRTVFANPQAAETSPAKKYGDGQDMDQLTLEQRKLSGALMRVNHVGEVCAQALYNAQALVTRDEALRQYLLDAAREETDHLAWTRERLSALGDRPSFLNPLWFAGAFAIGFAAAKVSDAVSLGFVVETENQVAAHLDSHLDRLPLEDQASRAVVERMRDDEQRHADQALEAGAMLLPPPVQALMRMAAKVMTTTAHHI